MPVVQDSSVTLKTLNAHHALPLLCPIFNGSNATSSTSSFLSSSSSSSSASSASSMASLDLSKPSNGLSFETRSNPLSESCGNLRPLLADLPADEDDDMEDDDEDDNGEEENIGCDSDESDERSKQRRKQSNPNRVDDEPIGSIVVPTSNATFESYVGFNKPNKGGEASENEVEHHAEEDDEDDDDNEAGLSCKHRSTLAGAATAVTKMLLASCGGSTLTNDDASASNQNKTADQDASGAQSVSDSGDNQSSQSLHFLHYLAAAAAVANVAESRADVKQVLHKCEHCSCPFLSADHKSVYEELQQREQAIQTQSRTGNRLMNELITVLGNLFEPGQLPDFLSFLKHIGM